jgi:hypothetical protein
MVDAPDWYAKPLAGFPAGYRMGVICRLCRNERTGSSSSNGCRQEPPSSTSPPAPAAPVSSAIR